MSKKSLEQHLSCKSSTNSSQWVGQQYSTFARAWNDEEQQWRSEARIARLTVICSGWMRHVELPLHSTSSLLLIIIAAAAAASQQQQQWWLWRSTTGSYVWETIEANSCVLLIILVVANHHRCMAAAVAASQQQQQPWQRF